MEKLGRQLKWKKVIIMLFLFVRTKYLPDMRELNSSKDKLEWVADVLEKYLSCKYSKLASEVFTQFITYKSTHGDALFKYLKGKSFFFYFHWGRLSRTNFALHPSVCFPNYFINSTTYCRNDQVSNLWFLAKLHFGYSTTCKLVTNNN